eukprot:scaffold86687_cov21-Phaeocystis_antarctica.AAC.1
MSIAPGAALHSKVRLAQSSERSVGLWGLEFARVSSSARNFPAPYRTAYGFTGRGPTKSSHP